MKKARLLVQLIGFVTAFFASLAAVDHLALGAENVVVFWPGDGILLGALFLIPIRRWPIVLVLAFATECFYAFCFASNPAAPAVALSLSNPMEAVLGAALLRQFLRDRSELVLSKLILLYIVLVAMLAAGLGASVGTYAYVRATPGVDFFRTWETWWLSEVLGLIIVTPVILSWGNFTWRLPNVAPRKWAEVMTFLAAFCGSLYLVFWQYTSDIPHFFEMPFVVVPVLLWAAFRFEQRTVALLFFAMAYGAVSATDVGRGFFAALPVNRDLQVIGLQFYLANTFAMVMFTSAALKDAERIRAEKRRMEIMLEQTDRLRLVGEMASGIAHDFNNLLTIIRGASELSGSLGTAGDAELTAMTRGAIDRCSALARKLQRLGKEQEEVTRLLDMNDLLRKIEPMLIHALGKERKLRTDISASVPLLVAANAGQLDEVILNLVVNARDAMPEGSTCRVETGSAKLDSVNASLFLRGREGDYVSLAVRDEGSGMDEETRRRIFEPFFTTKGEKGTGLGLAVVYGIVRKHDGCIRVESKPGHGTAITILLPRVLD